MALTMQPKKTREGVLYRFLTALSDDDRAEALGCLHDRNYGPSELARAFAADGYEGTANPNENVFLACSTRMDITSDKWLGAIHRVIDDCDPALVSIGPLYRLIQKGMNGEEDMGQILAALDTIRDRGIALIVEAHAGHSKDAAGTRELRPRGSSSLLGWPEFGFGLALEPGNENQVILQRWRGDREERDWPDGFMRGGPWPWTDPLMMQDVRHRAYGNNSLE